MPASFNAWTSSRNSSQVVGGASIPAWAKSSLLYQKPTMPRSKGMAYTPPSTSKRLTAPALRSPMKSPASSLISRTRPASTWSARSPPPQDWNKSGGSLDCSRGSMASLNASFSLTTMSKVTWGFISTNSSAIVCHNSSMAPWFWMCHHSMVTGSASPPPSVEDGASVSSGPSVVGLSSGAGASVAVVVSPAFPPPQAASSMASTATKAAHRLNVFDLIGSSSFLAVGNVFSRCVTCLVLLGDASSVGWSGAGLASDQAGGQRHVDRLGPIRGLDQGDQQPGGFLAQVLDRLIDGREWRVGQGGLGDVVEAHHREILRNAQVGGRGDLQRRYGRVVVGGEDGGGPVREVEAVPSSLLCRLCVVVAAPYH